MKTFSGTGTHNYFVLTAVIITLVFFGHRVNTKAIPNLSSSTGELDPSPMSTATTTPVTTKEHVSPNLAVTIPASDRTSESSTQHASSTPEPSSNPPVRQPETNNHKAIQDLVNVGRLTDLEEGKIAPVPAITRAFKSIQTLSVTKIDAKKTTANDEDAPLDTSNQSESFNFSIGSVQIAADKRHVGPIDLVRLDTIVTSLQDVQAIINATFEDICSKLQTETDSLQGMGCFKYAVLRGSDSSIRCNSSITHALVGGSDPKVILMNAALVLTDLQELVQSVTDHYNHLHGSPADCVRRLVPESLNHSRCRLEMIKLRLQRNVKNILMTIGLSEMEDHSHVTCRPDLSRARTFPLGVLWRVENDLNLVITNMRRVSKDI